MDFMLFKQFRALGHEFYMKKKQVFQENENKNKHA